MKIFCKKSIFFIISFIVIISFVVLNCKKQDETVEQSEQRLSEFFANQNTSVIFSSIETSSNTGRILYNPDRSPVLHRVNAVNINNLQFSVNAGAHRKYLNDPLTFFEISDGGFPTGATAVVGSDFCIFYPVENITEAALSRLPAGEPIPFAAIIPLGEEIRKSTAQWDNMFFFQGHYNYFYKTTWNGRQGIVFGADLYGIGLSNNANRINSLLYKNSGIYENFHHFTGYERLGTNVLTDLETNGLAFQEVRKSEYNLDMYSNKTDDMISLYMDLAEKPALSIFVTTDLAAHANHLVFSRMLQYIEEEYFYPQLLTLTNEYIKIIEQLKEQIPVNIYNTSLLYFLTAHALLELAPNKYDIGDFTRTIGYQEIDERQVLKNYPSQVVQEIEKMNAASGFGKSSIFGFDEDYSQYKVRGHYTKNGVLGAYFRALMWYGRINFNLGADGNTSELARNLAPAALFITDITENSPEIKKLWQSLFDPITELIGASDDIGFYELSLLWNKIKGEGFNQWYSDPSRLETFITTDYRELRAPSISGSSLLFDRPHAGGNAMEDRLPPVGWRLFGQRYTLDSEIHHLLSPPRLMPPSLADPPRNMVRGLDIMKVLGSKTADRLLRDDYIKYHGFENAINSLQRNLTNLNNDYWFSTYYTNILLQIKTLAQFENGSGFYFTEKPNWNLKAMNSAHGTWAELRHATVLYVKQNYAEMGGGREDPTFRTKPLPQPVHYIEPNIPFWNTSVIAFQKLYQILEKYDYLDGRTAQVLTRMHELYIKAAEISALQAEDKEVSRADLTWISRFAGQLASLVVTHIGGNQVDDIDSLRMALVTDVFTNAEINMVLETAVGIPYRLYVPLNDGQGGKRIAIGYGFSYYEFNQPISNRLTNEEWKAIVYADNPNMNQYLPFWMIGRVLPPK